MPALNQSALALYTPAFLTGLAIRQERGVFIAQKLAPLYPSVKQAGIIPEIDPQKNARRVYATKKAAGSSPTMIQVFSNKDRTFFCEKHFAGYPVTAEELANADSELAEMVEGPLGFLMESLEIEREANFLSYVTANFTPVNIDISNPATATPAAQITEIIAEIASTSIKPNAMGLSILDATAIYNCAEVQDRFINTLTPSQQAGPDRTTLEQALSSVFLINVFITENDGVNNSPDGTAAPDLESLWEGKSFLCRVEPKSRRNFGTACHTVWNAMDAIRSQYGAGGKSIGANVGGIQDGFNFFQVYDEKRQTLDVLASAYYDLVNLTGEQTGRYLTIQRS